MSPNENMPGVSDSGHANIHTTTKTDLTSANPFDDSDRPAEYVEHLLFGQLISEVCPRIVGPDDFLTTVFAADKKAYSAYVRFLSRVGLQTPTTVDEIEAVPAEVLTMLGCRVPTRGEVREFCKDVDVPDPESTVRKAKDDKAAKKDDGKIDHAAMARVRFAGPPISLRGAQALPPFPVDALPGPYRQYVESVAIATQTDPAMAATILLGVLATASQRCVEVEVEVRRGYREPLSLFVVAVAAPAERKSSVFDAIAGPLLDAERTLVERASDVRTEAKTRQSIASTRAEDARKNAAKGSDPDLDAEAVRLANEAASVRIPPMPRLRVDDITAEALASRLAEFGERLGVLSSEGGIFATVAGRYSNGVANLDVLLKGYSGDACRIDRADGRSEQLDRPALSMVLTIQPTILERACANELFVGSGLMARIAVALPPSLLGRRDTNAPPVDAMLEADYRCRVASLAVDLAEFLDQGAATLRLTPDAHTRIVELSNRIEPRLGPAGDLAALGMTAWAGKQVGRVARIAALLHLAEHEREGIYRPVEATTMDDAERIGEFYLAHTTAAFAGQIESAALQDADVVVEALRRISEKSNGFTFRLRDVQKVLPERLRKAGAVDASLALLERHGFVAVEHARPPGGGRTSTNVTLNPDEPPSI